MRGDNENVDAVAGGPTPDVTVSTVDTSAHPGIGFGNVGGISAFAIRTISCNIGTVDLRWEQATTRHPVIAQNVFRLKDGQFEHIGMSWVKHGFLAVNETRAECGTCDDPGSTSRLGPGCSDVYSATLNADQSGLGPRSEVNAYTGQFLFPHGECPEDTAIDGRIQIHNEDLDASLNVGAKYFIEGHYVTADDAAAGNGDNNASWREVAVTYSPSEDFYRLARINDHLTHTWEHAIYAWQEQDNGVQIVPARVPGEGVFLVGVRATPLGTGFWRYEYALQNSNSDRSARSFRVPIPAGAILANIGFHDVDYHTGEPYDLTDWAVTQSETAIVWATQTFDENPNANALRWSTLHNFRFDANVEPVSTTVDIGLFKPGALMSLGAPAIGPRLTLIDCNKNGLHDNCDVDCGPVGGECQFFGCGTSIDCNDNGVPDECELDCNQNGIADMCDLESGPSEDCNGNTVPDECEPDCDDDGLPDDCDGSDQDQDGVIDCDDLCPTTSPPGSCTCPVLGACCQPAGGFCASFLPDFTQIPGCDCCFPGDGICFLEITYAACTSIPGAYFECEGSPCRDGCLIGDADFDGDYDLADVGVLQNCYSGSTESVGFVPPTPICSRLFDKDDDGDVDGLDFSAFYRAFTDE